MFDTSKKLGSSNSWLVAYCAINKGKYAVPSLLNGPEAFSSASDKEKLLAENFYKN